MSTCNFLGSYQLYTCCNVKKPHIGSFKQSSFSQSWSKRPNGSSYFHKKSQLGRSNSVIVKASDSRTTRKQVEITYNPEEKFHKLADEVDREAGLSRLALFSPCKINVFLRITGKRDDGYHELASLFHVISLGDKIKFSLSPSKSKDRLSTNVAGVPLDERNLIIKALNLYRKKTGTDKYFWIHLDKKVPTGAGLGGGSSNAATALWAANQFSGCLATEKELQEWSGEIGSDISFFFSHGAAYCTGRGEVVQDIPSPIPFDIPMVLIKPQQECSTAEVYKRFLLDQTSNVDPLSLLEKIKTSGISQDVCVNDLEPPAFEVLPSLKRLKQRVIAAGRGQYDAVFMSGSGSTIVGVGSPDPPQFVYDDEEYKDVFLSEASFITRAANQWYEEPLSAGTFRKLAKETHPDLLPHSTPNSSSTSKQFVDILAAYEILSDAEKREHYDQYLSARKTLVHVHSRQGSKMCMYESYSTSIKEMEVVEWLKWYRQTVNDILAEKRVVSGSGYFDALERDFYSALHLAFYGPEIESDLLPECFEAEERSVYETAEVLHLVFGRDLFGMVCLAKNVPELSHASMEKLTSFTPGLCHSIENIPMKMHPETAHSGSDQRQLRCSNYRTSDAYRNLELHVGRRLVAVATRVPPRSRSNGIQNEGFDDCIHVYLNSDGVQRFSKSNFTDFGLKSAIPLGMITGLGTSPEEGSCDVYDNNGLKTHVIMKHRTLLVRHMHWYQLGDEVSTCECRCRRARLPPSKFWLFEPRCGMHDIGGWYVETFGRDMKGRNVLSQRYWDGFGTNDQFEKRLHPAMYLLALAYRTLDIEDSRRSKQRMKDLVESNVSRILSWCKRLVH